MFQVASDSIQSPAHNDLDPRAASIKKKPVKTGPAILRPAHFIGVFSINSPAPRLAVATEFEELVFARLGAVRSADAGVDSGLHGSTALPLSFGMILTVILSSLRKARSAVGDQEVCRRNETGLLRAGQGCPGMRSASDRFLGRCEGDSRSELRLITAPYSL